MTQFITSNSIQPGTGAPIPNELASAQLDTTLLVDPVKITAFKQSVADQLNQQSGGPKFEDLSDRIAGITIETSAQGASILKVDISDPMWLIPMSGFIQVDKNGYLWPPIDINFPTGTNCTWRLCQYHAVWADDMSTPNLTLTFEDKIVGLLREMSPAANGGLSQGLPNQTLGGFIKMLVDNANASLRLGEGEEIILIELLSPQDPNYVAQITNLPSASKRLRPNRERQGLTQQMNDLLNHLNDHMLGSFPTSGNTTKLAQLEELAVSQWSTLNPNQPGWVYASPPLPGSTR